MTANPLSIMRLSARPAHRRGQGGFVQSLLIGGLILLSVIAGAVAYFNRGASTKFDTETTRMDATLVVTIGNDLHGAMMRWRTDHSGFPALNTEAGNVYDPALGLATERTLPVRLFIMDHADPFVADESVIRVGSDDAVPELVVAIDRLTDDVCRQINRIVNSAAPDEPIPTAWQTSGEGCAKGGFSGDTSLDNTYFKVVEFRR